MGEVSKRKAQRLRNRMAAMLASQGAVADPRWRTAFEQVPRHVFLSRFFKPHPDGGWTAVADSDHEWLDLVYSDWVWVTQLDCDERRWATARQQGRTPGTATSSSSMPTIMAIMLEALEIRGGEKVLEVGTGTGYNAALLCHRLGQRNVSTVDVDPLVLRRAAANLERAGYRPTVSTSDGAAGYAPTAPYDRVLATCSVARIPLPWLAQTVVGGLVVTTLHRPLGAGLVRVRAGRNSTGEGSVLPADGRFMPLRAHRGPELAELLRAIGESPAPASPTKLGMNVVTSPSSAFEFFAGLALPGVRPATGVTEGDARQNWLLHPDGSWVRHISERGRHHVEQGGPRRLWDETEHAYERWRELGEPRREQFRLTIDSDGQWIWLDEPSGGQHWELESA
ncbi:methyltransferase domain-containing protein [Allokutzneria multivorans]|uniref:Protein-L-isoaspartate O-methyltransferase n=1 Tax=Allokutzneria multivorans TaxID=1142134 RepID=A0ABP7RSY6_9PSEU